MPDYNQSELTGTSWQRCKMVNIANPHSGVPRVRLDEEVVAIAGDKSFYEHAGAIEFDFDPGLSIPLRNPQTGNLIPGVTMSGLDVYVALYSLYILKAHERDAALVPPEVP